MNLASQRLRYRPITAADFDNVCSFLQDIEVMYAWEFAFSDEQVHEWLAKNQKRYDTSGYGYFACETIVDGQFVGVAGFMDDQMEGKPCTEIAYLFVKQHWGKGYAAEAAATMRDYAFTYYAIPTLVAQIKPDNLSSRKVAEKIGMSVTGEFIKPYMGRQIPHLIYTLHNPKGSRTMTERKRIRQWMDIPSRFQPGEKNAITDVAGVTVGHFTLRNEDKHIHTGITAIKQHQKDPFAYRVPAAVNAGNGHTKFSGSVQIEELGELESYICLTNTLNVGNVLQGLVEYHMESMKNLPFKSINAVVGETNDGSVSDILGFHVQKEHVKLAFDACSDVVEEGAVGAGTGLTLFGYKGGMGTASRVIEGKNIGESRSFTVGAMVQANFGGNLNIYGKLLPHNPLKEMPMRDEEPRGSCSIIVATDAPMNDRQLKRLAKRAIVGMTMTGAYLSNTSGDYALAFSNHEGNLRVFSDKHIRQIEALSEDQMNPFMEATVEAVQEAVYNALCMSPHTIGADGKLYAGFDITKIL